MTVVSCNNEANMSAIRTISDKPEAGMKKDKDD
jgi:hypothetical protein